MAWPVNFDTLNDQQVSYALESLCLALNQRRLLFLDTDGSRLASPVAFRISDDNPATTSTTPTAANFAACALKGPAIKSVLNSLYTNMTTQGIGNFVKTVGATPSAMVMYDSTSIVADAGAGLRAFDADEWMLDNFLVLKRGFDLLTKYRTPYLTQITPVESDTATAYEYDHDPPGDYWDEVIPGTASITTGIVSSLRGMGASYGSATTAFGLSTAHSRTRKLDLRNVAGVFLKAHYFTGLSSPFPVVPDTWFTDLPMVFSTTYGKVSLCVSGLTTGWDIEFGDDSGTPVFGDPWDGGFTSPTVDQIKYTTLNSSTSIIGALADVKALWSGALTPQHVKWRGAGAVDGAFANVNPASALRLVMDASTILTDQT